MAIKKGSSSIAESDSMSRNGISSVYKKRKESSERNLKLQDAETRQKTLDFIFGKSEENPLDKK